MTRLPSVKPSHATNATVLYTPRPTNHIDDVTPVTTAAELPNKNKPYDTKPYDAIIN
jgi:hypothetical protein